MTAYGNTNGDSGVASYEAGGDYIVVWFKNTSKSYKYSHRSAGASKVEAMKSLAASGDGLNSYINTNKPGFE